MGDVGGGVEDHSDMARALFLSRHAHLISDHRVCSGDLPARLEGKACPFAVDGRFPRLGGEDGAGLPDCVDREVGRLGDWLTGGVPEPGYEDLAVFRCLQMFLLVLPQAADRPFDGGSKRG